MEPRTFVQALLTGCVLIALGLIPGLFQQLQDGIESFAKDLRLRGLGQIPLQPFRPRIDRREPARALWLTGLGATIIVLSSLMFFYG